MKNLLIVYHSQSGKNLEMANAVHTGATHPDISGVEVRFLRAFDAGAEDLLWADGIIFGTPENFGYMSGAMKDFFDRTFYSVEGAVEAKPYCVFIGAGNDGQGALSSLTRIIKGYKFKEIHEPLIIVGELTEEVNARCEELGMGMAAGLEAGIY
ncbi:MAG: flavodoxin [Gammaproteobacteria bacterium]|jgi:multimeric flavodoxin WrbA|nr:flavodoxin [Gammaproteobacteria bacterium]|tara:strand:+ start:109 stop:570 length:462 start_codon:yes stop_codon:yes gene_type:complete